MMMNVACTFVMNDTLYDITCWVYSVIRERPHSHSPRVELFSKLMTSKSKLRPMHTCSIFCTQNTGHFDHHVIKQPMFTSWHISSLQQQWLSGLIGSIDYNFQLDETTNHQRKYDESCSYICLRSTLFLSPPPSVF
jgi:hypothetical protein